MELSSAVVEELRRAAPERAEELVARHRQLAEVLTQQKDREKSLSKVQRRQQNEVLAEKIKVEKVRETYDAERRDLEALDAQREQLRKQLEDLEQKETVSKYEAAELERTVEELVEKAEEQRRENARLVEPELEKLEAVFAATKAELKRTTEAFERESARKRAMLERSEALADEKQMCQLRLHETKEVVQRVSVEPERIQKQADAVQKASNKLRAEISRVDEKNVHLEDEIKRQSSKRKEAEDVRKNLLHKLELHRDTILHRQRDVDAVRKNVEIERARTHQLAETKVKLELRRRELDDETRHETDAVSLAKKELEALRRRYRNKRSVASAAKEILPTLKAQVADHEHLLRSHLEENKAHQKQADQLRQDVDLSIARLLRQEGLEKEDRVELEQLLKEVATMEDEIANWAAEDRRQTKLIAVLSAQRELKAREASRAQVAEKETREQVKVKELVLLDLTKKHHEVSNRLKEFSALYDVVKNERNKYVNLIQSSSQALAEMKEKIKILMNEVEILRNESVAKDKALHKEHSQHLASQVQRDSLRLDLYKSQAEYRRKQEVVEQQIVEIDKLNSIINNLERDMLRLKTRYEMAVEARNSTGVWLIDRNDELCILYEKVNVQEQTIQGGELGVRQKEEDIRMLRLQLAELQRQVIVTRRQLPQMPALANQVVRLQQDLRLERDLTEKLCRDLESPANSTRWRALPGEDPERDQLIAKTAVLEERLNLKKEALLENELVLEEVTNLANKLRFRATEGRDQTISAARRLNDVQSRIRDATRKMMSVVSELSMYQATAMKLQQQKRHAAAKVDDAKWRLAQDEPPSEDAAKDLNRKRTALLTAATLPASDARPAMTTAANPLAVRTTAEPRPNAYIPDVTHGLGVPKPYGHLAPFKPSQPGATQRHIREPRPQVIVL